MASHRLTVLFLRHGLQPGPCALKLSASAPEPVRFCPAELPAMGRYGTQTGRHTRTVSDLQADEEPASQERLWRSGSAVWFCRQRQSGHRHVHRTGYSWAIDLVITVSLVKRSAEFTDN